MLIALYTPTPTHSTTTCYLNDFYVLIHLQGAPGQGGEVGSSGLKGAQVCENHTNTDKNRMYSNALRWDKVQQQKAQHSNDHNNLKIRIK
jgi:hypothetical protein